MSIKQKKIWGSFCEDNYFIIRSKHPENKDIFLRCFLVVAWIGVLNDMWKPISQELVQNQQCNTFKIQRKKVLYVDWKKKIHSSALGPICVDV